MTPEEWSIDMTPDDRAAPALADDALFAVANEWQAAGHRLVFCRGDPHVGSSPRQTGQCDASA